MLVNSDLKAYKRVVLLTGGMVMLLLFAYVIGSMAALIKYGILPLAFICGLCGAFLIFRWPLIGFALMFFLVPMGPVTRMIGGERTLSFALGAFLIGLFVTKILIFSGKIILDSIPKFAFALIGWGIISSIWAYDSGLSVQYALRVAQMIVLYLLVMNYCRSRLHLDVITMSFVMGAAVVATVPLFMGTTYLGWDASTVGRLTVSEDFNPNLFSTVLGIGLILIFYHLYKARNNLIKLLLVLAIVPTAYSIILAQSRATWLAMIASPLVSTIFITRNPKTVKRVTIVIIILIGVFISAFYSGIINENIVERFQTLLSEDSGTITSGRDKVWRAGFGVIKENFPLGVGFKNFGIAIADYSATSADPTHLRDAHNTFLSVLVETGFIGFVLFMSIFIHLVKSIWNIADPMVRFMALWLLGFIVLASSSGTYHFTPWFWFALMFIDLESKVLKQGQDFLDNKSAVYATTRSA